jgi:hypothetical protein
LVKTFRQLIIFVWFVIILINHTNFSQTENTDSMIYKWTNSNSKELTRIIETGKDKGKIAVFDFDNTLLCGDIGEAVFEELINSGNISIDGTEKTLIPHFTSKTNGSEIDLIQYYNYLLDEFDDQDPFSANAIGYAWCVQIMNGITLDVLIQKTDIIMKEIVNHSISDSQTDGMFFYPEMIKLIADLIKNKFEIYIISASNIWSVRYAITNYYNKLLSEKFGCEGIEAKNIFGINTLLMKTGSTKLIKDSYLIKTNSKYRQNDFDELSQYKLTGILNLPVSTYEGKSAIIEKHISKDKIYLAAGDSPNDFGLFRNSENHIWIARLNKPSYQTSYLKNIMNQSLTGIVQPTITEDEPGFVQFLDDPISPKVKDKNIKESLRIINHMLK